MDIWISGYASGTMNTRCIRSGSGTIAATASTGDSDAANTSTPTMTIEIEPLETHQNATVDDPASCMGTQTEQVRAMAEGNKKAKCRPSIAIDGGDDNDRIQQVQYNGIR